MGIPARRVTVGQECPTYRMRMKSPGLRFLPLLAAALLLAAAGGSWLSGGIVYELLLSDLDAAERVTRLRALFDQAGVWAPLVYVLFVIVEVIVAPIPGIMLYAPGGLIFGPWLGGLLALIGNVIGAGISCGLTRSLGSSWLNRVSSGTAMDKLQTALEKDGSRLIVMLRLNPLTSTDLLSYAAGFTRIPIHRVMLATGIGMAPLCFLQSWLSDNLFNKWPWLLWPLLGLGVVYLMVVVVVITRLLLDRTTAPHAEQ